MPADVSKYEVDRALEVIKLYPTHEECEEWGLYAQYGIVDTLLPDFLDFVAEYFIQPKGVNKGKPFTFCSWQLQFLERLLMVDADGNLYFRRAILYIAKKNGKSTLMAMVMIYILMGQGPTAFGPQLVIGASTAKQAKFPFAIIENLINDSPKLKKKIRATKGEITCASNRGLMKIVASGAGSAESNVDGSELDAGLLDEAALHPDDALEVSMSSAGRNSPSFILMAATTAGDPTRTDFPFFQEYESHKLDPASNTREGFEEALKTRTLWAFFEAPDINCDIFDYEAFKAANPTPWVSYRRHCEDAETAIKKNSINRFRRYNLNQMVTLSTEGWIHPDRWAELEELSIDEDSMQGQAAVYTLDVGLDSDSTVVTYFFPLLLGHFTKEELIERLLDASARDVITVKDNIERIAAIINHKRLQTKDDEERAGYEKEQLLLASKMPITILDRETLDLIIKYKPNERSGFYWFFQKHYVPTEFESVSILQVEAELKETIENDYRCLILYADQWQARQLLEGMNELGIQTEIVQQQLTSIAPLAYQMQRLALDGLLLHGGKDEEARKTSDRQILNAAKKELKSHGAAFWGISKDTRVSGRERNDAAMSLVFAMGYITEAPDDDISIYQRLLEEGKPLVEGYTFGESEFGPNAQAPTSEAEMIRRMYG